jgi:hypothetical protein
LPRTGDLPLFSDANRGKHPDAVFNATKIKEITTKTFKYDQDEVCWGVWNLQ